MAKKITVMDFLAVVGALSDAIPVTVKHNQDVLCEAKNLRWLAAHGMPYELEARVREIEIRRESIVIRVQPKDYSTKV